MPQQVIERTSDSFCTLFKITECRYENVMGSYIGYGIEVWENGRRIDMVPDISCDRRWVLALVDKINQGELSPIHLRDVLYDCMP